MVKRLTLGLEYCQFQDYEKSMHIHLGICNLLSEVLKSPPTGYETDKTLWVPCDFKECYSFACISDGKLDPNQLDQSSHLEKQCKIISKL